MRPTWIDHALMVLLCALVAAGFWLLLATEARWWGVAMFVQAMFVQWRLDRRDEARTVALFGDDEDAL